MLECEFPVSIIISTLYNIIGFWSFCIFLSFSLDIYFYLNITLASILQPGMARHSIDAGSRYDDILD